MLDAAEAHCDAAISRDRHYSLAHYLRSDLRIQTADRNHIAEMEALIREGKLSGPERGHAALRAWPRNTKIWISTHRAFDHVELGSDLQRRSISYDGSGGDRGD